MDNILLAQDILVGYNKKAGAPNYTLKIDIQKAYDTVNWRFLEKALNGFGFHDLMVKWIMMCVKSPWFMISINGEDNGFFVGKRGLRQGDPLSPYLFTLVMEVFNLIIKRNIEMRLLFKYHRKCRFQKITHICFADDLLVFCSGQIRSVRIIKNSLDLFRDVSGLNASMTKSQFFFQLC